MTEPDRELIRVRGLNSFYGRKQVLRDLSFSVEANRIFVIMGMSGCGKSTLLKHLVGLKPSPPGSIYIEGKDISGWNHAQWNNYWLRIGILFQNGALFNSMTVAQNIALPLMVHTNLPKEIIEIMVEMKLHMVGLSGTGALMPSQLSGGMRKRAGLARALSMDPEILFVDEPSSGLDPITAAGLDELLLSLKETFGMTLVVVTHELESAFRIGDQMVVMDQGRIIAYGTPEEIRQMNDPRVQQFLSRRPDEEHRDYDSYISRLCKVKRR
ncbi:MAG: ATP-binding cassette domain-containing protein [Syntrophobacterales bacterium]|nr:ATP-binding cassette domain-containing protein [Syntrophobacterales bacterium]